MYKIIKDNYVIDVSNTFLAENSGNHALVSTTEDNIHFLLSSDGKTLYKAPWCYGYIFSKYNAVMVDAVKISEEEFLELKEQLQLEPVVYEPEKEEQVITEETNSEQEILDPVEMKKKIIELEKLVQQLLNK